MFGVEQGGASTVNPIILMDNSPCREHSSFIIKIKMLASISVASK